MLSRLNGIIYEYACHEGNSMDVMLRGARLEDENGRSDRSPSARSH